ncbi:MAG: DUF4907 domain-containing protein [Cytophagales bacterium]|nr:MAG: DUF4907 domain-containing protein [Cytophagales bacterium]
MKTNAAHAFQQITAKQVMVVCFVLLMCILIYHRIQPRPGYELLVTAHATGWGYTILQQGKPLIDQPVVPGSSGSAGFQTEIQAQRVGQYVIQKLTTQPGLPTLTPDELLKLGIPTQ